MSGDALNRDGSVPEDFWANPQTQTALARRDMAALFMLLRRYTGHSQTRLGAMTGLAQGHVSDIVRGGRKVIALETFERIADGLGMPDNARILLGLAPNGGYTGQVTTQQIANREQRTYRTQEATIGQPGVDQTHDGDAGHGATNNQGDKEQATNRRDVLFLGTTAAAHAAFDLLWSEPARMRATMTVGSIGLEQVAELQDEATDLALRVIRIPPSHVLAPAITRFREIRELLDQKQRLRVRKELLRAAAMFATVTGEALFNRGQPDIALRWYNTARQAALEATDQYQADIALCGATYVPTYAADPSGVLVNVDARLTAHTAATPAVAWLWAFKAKAHAMRKERAAFETAIDKSRHSLDNSPPDLVRPGIFSFLPEKLAMYEARGRVELHDCEQAADAADRAVSLYDPTETTEPALARFERASALAQAGEQEESVRIALAALLDPHTYRGATVTIRAREYDQLLGDTKSRVVEEWRENLRSLSPARGMIDA